MGDLSGGAGVLGGTIDSHTRPLVLIQKRVSRPPAGRRYLLVLEETCWYSSGGSAVTANLPTDTNGEFFLQRNSI